MVSMMRMLGKQIIFLDGLRTVLAKLASVADNTNESLKVLTGMVDNTNKSILEFKKITRATFKRQVHETVAIKKSKKIAVSLFISL